MEQNGLNNVQIQAFKGKDTTNLHIVLNTATLGFDLNLLRQIKPISCISIEWSPHSQGYDW